MENKKSFFVWEKFFNKPLEGFIEVGERVASLSQSMVSNFVVAEIRHYETEKLWEVFKTSLKKRKGKEVKFILLTLKKGEYRDGDAISGGELVCDQRSPRWEYTTSGGLTLGCETHEGGEISLWVKHPWREKLDSPERRNFEHWRKLEENPAFPRISLRERLEGAGWQPVPEERRPDLK